MRVTLVMQPRKGLRMARNQIREILLELFEAETGEAVASLRDDQCVSEKLGLDSVDMVILIMQLERRFKVRLTHEELAQAQQFGQLVDLVQRKISECHPSAAA